MRKVILRSNKSRRKLRVRKKVKGTAERPRLSVYRSNKFIYGQIVDDKLGNTLVNVQAESQKLHKGKDKSKAAFAVGEMIGQKAKEKKISTVVFDRGSYKYHGRVKSFAEGARKGGLTF